MRKVLEKEGVAVEETEPLLRQRAMVGGGLLVIRWRPPDPLQGNMIATLLRCGSACMHKGVYRITVVYHMRLNFCWTKLSWIANLLNIHRFFRECWERINMADHLVPGNLCI